MSAKSIGGRIAVALCIAVWIWSLSVGAQTSTSEWLGCLGLGAVGGLAGAAVAVTVIAELTPQIESALGRTAVVIGGLTVLDGLGAAAGVLTAGKIWDLDGSIGGCVLGGLAGGLASAFVEPLSYLLGIPESWTEFLGMAFLPILPAIGATIGFGS